MEYCLTFFSATGILWVAEKTNIQRVKPLKWFVVILGLLIPSVLAGYRDATVGTDTVAYYNYFSIINNCDTLKDAMTQPYLLRLQLEKGYVLLNYLVSRMSDSPNTLLTVVALLTNLFAYIGCYRYKGRCPTWLLMLMYFFVFFCNYLNIARQGLATVIVFSAYRYLEDKKYVRYIIWMAIAATFHSTAVISGLMLIFVHIFLSKKVSIVRCGLIVLGSLALFFTLNRLVPLIMLVFPGYSGYITRADWNSASLSRIVVLLRIPFFLLTTFYLAQISSTGREYTQLRYSSGEPHLALVRKGSQISLGRISQKMRQHVQHPSQIRYLLYFVMIWLEFIVTQFGTYYYSFERMAWYFVYYKLLIVAEIYLSYGARGKSTSRSNQKAFAVLMVIWAIAYWYIFTVKNLYGFSMPVYPYTSTLLGI